MASGHVANSNSCMCRFMKNYIELFIHYLDSIILSKENLKKFQVMESKKLSMQEVLLLSLVPIHQSLLHIILSSSVVQYHFMCNGTMKMVLHSMQPCKI